MDVVRLGFIGLGGWGTRLAQAARSVAGATVVVGTARSEERRTTFGATFGCAVTADVGELLAMDIDAVVIATPHSTHRELVARSLTAGRHVFVEKPLTLTVADARAVVDQVQDSGLVLQVGHQRRRLPANAAIRDWSAAGELGDLHLVQATISSPSGLKSRPGWQSDPRERPLGGMTGLGVHMVDMLLFLAGPAVTVSAVSSAIGVPGPIDIVTTLQIGLASGAVGQVATSTIGARVATVAAFGTRATAWSEEDGTRLFRQDVDAAARAEVDVVTSDPIRDQFVDFVRHVNDGSRPDSDATSGLAVVSVMAAAQESVTRHGLAVRIDEVC